MSAAQETSGTPDYYGGTETIEKQETVVGILAGLGVEPEAAFSAATALKYSDRAGSKPGNDYLEDMGKCANYLFRAIEGRWPWESE